MSLVAQHVIQISGVWIAVVSMEANLFVVECNDGWLGETLSKQQVYRESSRYGPNGPETEGPVTVQCPTLPLKNQDGWYISIIPILSQAKLHSLVPSTFVKQSATS
jgi:hypothetical protein